MDNFFVSPRPGAAGAPPSKGESSNSPLEGSTAKRGGVASTNAGHSTILDLPKHACPEPGRRERPREKLLEKGTTGLKDKELLAILLRTGNAKLNAIELADWILKKYPLKKLLSFSARDFMGVKGVDAGKA